MLFNSFQFLLFFFVVLAVYYATPAVRNREFQNGWLLLCGYVFYAFSSVKMLPLLMLSTLLFWGLGFWLRRSLDGGNETRAKYVKWLGCCVGVGILFYFKYLGFFAEQIASALGRIGLSPTWPTMYVAIPCGVSFFVFRLISYLIEIDRGRIEPCEKLVDFALYISFFPCILSGPIDRPDKFLRQIERPRSFDYGLAVDGCRQILWGMFTKMCIADNLARMTDTVWAGYGSMSASVIFLCAILYPIQMYADFDGYSNMAIGIAKILGIRVARNFNHPFLGRNMAEFWRGWHMSLTQWCTDYIYMPLTLSFRDKGRVGTALAVIVNFIVIGFWHGANWTYGLFGLYHGLLFFPLVLSSGGMKKTKLSATRYGLPHLWDVAKMLVVYVLVAGGLIIFRAPSVQQAFAFFAKVSDPSALTDIMVGGGQVMQMMDGAVKFSLVVLIPFSEWFCRRKEHALQLDGGIFFRSVFLRRALYVVLILCILIFKGSETEFIYFQF